MRAARCGLAVLCTVMLFGCKRTEGRRAGEAGSGAPRAAPAPVPMPAQSAEFPKSLVLTFAINDTTLNVTSVKVVSSRTHTYVGHPDQFRVALLDRQGRVLGTPLPFCHRLRRKASGGFVAARRSAQCGEHASEKSKGGTRRRSRSTTPCRTARSRN